MILITGGAYQGKGDFARKWKTDHNDADAVIVEHIHRIIRQALCEKRDPREDIKKILDAHPDAILTVDELGCGVVPIDASDREWREVTGRICCELAAQAEAVYRVICGAGIRIK